MKKKLIAVAGAGVLTAAAAVPALAFENEFHGMFQVQGITTNFLTGTTGNVNPINAWHQQRTFVDQRARLQYIAKASDDLKLVTHFELDGRWGDVSYSNSGRNTGYALGGDGINIETKNVYLDFNIPGAPINAKVGLQGLTDAYSGIFVGNDAAGVLLTSKVGNGTYSAGWFRFDDRGASAPISLGRDTRDFMLLDAAYNVSKDLKVGASYYYYNDDNSTCLASATPANNVFAGNGNNVALHMLGVNGAATAGPVALNGFFLYQNGTFKNFVGVAAGSRLNQHISAFAAGLGAKVKAGVGNVKANLLYVSGGNVAQQSIGNSFISAVNENSSAYPESGVGWGGNNSVILSRGNGYRTSNTDQSIVEDPSHKGAGLMAMFLGYDGAVGKTFFNVNAAFVADAKQQKNAPGVHDQAQYVGTELNAEVGYKIYDNLKASVQYAYAFLGPQFSNSSSTVGNITPLNGVGPYYANNPFLARVILGYSF